MSNGIENGLLFNPTQPMENCIMCKQEFAPGNINISISPQNTSIYLCDECIKNDNIDLKKIKKHININ